MSADIYIVEIVNKYILFRKGRYSMWSVKIPGSRGMLLPLAAALVLCASLLLNAQNAIVDTCREPEFKSQNMFESYWYVFDDNPNSVDYAGLWKDSAGIGWLFLGDSLTGGNSKVENFTKKTVSEYEEFHMTPGGCDGTPAYSAMIAWKFGDTLPHWGPGTGDVYGCYVGIGTGLISEAKTLNLTNATKVSYWAKSSATIVVNFVVATAQGSFKEFGTFYGIDHTIIPGWHQYFVYLGEKDPTNPTDSNYLYQPSWAVSSPNDNMFPWETEQHAVLPLNTFLCTLLEWNMGGAGETDHPNKDWLALQGTLWVDNIEIENYTWHPEDACVECDTAANSVANLPGNKILLTNGGWWFSTTNGAWYAFNDAEGRNVSIPMVEYSWIDTLMADYIAPDSTIPQLKLLDKTGIGDTVGDTAAYVSYVLGPSFKKVSSIDSTDTNDVDPFVGIGLDLVNDEDTTQNFNFDSLNIQGIYFDYKTTGAVEWVVVSFMTRQTFLEEGASFYVKVRPTDGVWRGAIVPFENIDLPPWDDKDTISFDATKGIAIQFTVEGDSNDVGSFAIDNVYLLDSAHVGVQYLTEPAPVGSGFSLKQINNRLVYTLPQGTRNAIVQLYNLQGRTVYSQRIKALDNAGSYSLPLRTNMIANGVYIFRVQTLGQQKRVFNKAVTLVE
jgi:hypothetical protein